MSYCRFSCDNFKSDVYCYESETGWMTHVASQKLARDIEPDPPLSEILATDWLARHRLHLEDARKAERIPIGLLHDGETFKDEDAAGMLDRLLYLRKLGYYVPEHAIEALREEITEDALLGIYHENVTGQLKR